MPKGRCIDELRYTPRPPRAACPVQVSRWLPNRADLDSIISDLNKHGLEWVVRRKSLWLPKRDAYAVFRELLPDDPEDLWDMDPEESEVVETYGMEVEPYE